MKERLGASLVLPLLLKALLFQKTCHFFIFHLVLCDLGTGGQEACLFTMEMFQMYQKYVQFLKL
jgi:hypothetical protein